MRRPPTAPLTAGLVLLAALATTSAGAPASADDHRPPAATRTTRTAPPVSSDGRGGTLVRDLAPSQQRRATTTDRSRETVAPGLVLQRWTRTDARGPQRFLLLRVTLGTPGLTMGLANTGHVAGVATVRRLVSSAGAVAGVNGDFYDIGRTGAPLGFTVQRGELFEGRASGWNHAFWIDAKGRPHVGDVALHARLPQRPGLTVTNLNSHFVAPGGIGVYTRAWATTRPGYDVTQGTRSPVRQLVVRHGRVVSSSARLTPGDPMRGQLVIGRGDGAKALARIAVGSRLTPRWQPPTGARMVVTGSTVLLDGPDGPRLRDLDDSVLAPRTAVGIDHDTGQVLLLAVDGRSDASRGATLREMARRMTALGADEALNLDGGGSTTLVTRRDGGKVRVRNTPSDGFERKVSNAVVLWYAPPAS